MSTATLSETTATQLTFPWAMPAADEAGTIVAESASTTTRHNKGRSAKGHALKSHSLPSRSERQQLEAREATAQASVVCEVVKQVEAEQVAPTLQAALVGDRIGKSFKVGDVMFRLLKSYGITDEEIAAGVASYHAKRRMQAATPAN